MTTFVIIVCHHLIAMLPPSIKWASTCVLVVGTIRFGRWQLLLVVWHHCHGLHGHNKQTMNAKQCIYQTTGFCSIAFRSCEFHGTFWSQFQNAQIPLDWYDTGMQKIAGHPANFIPLDSSGFRQELGGHCKDLQEMTEHQWHLSMGPSSKSYSPNTSVTHFWVPMRWSNSWN